MEALVPILFIVAFVGVFGWAIWSGNKTRKRRSADLADRAAREGWLVSERTDGRQRKVTIRPAKGGWSVELGHPFRRSSGKNSSSNPGSTTFLAAEPSWPGGRAVFSQKMPGGMDKMLGGTGLVGFLQNTAVRSLLGRVVGADIAADLHRLAPFEPPPGIELSILATEDPRGGDLAAVHQAVHGWRPVHHNDRSPPAVIIGPEGTSLRLGYCLAEVEDIAALVTAGQDLVARLAASGRA